MIPLLLPEARLPGFGLRSRLLVFGLLQVVQSSRLIPSHRVGLLLVPPVALLTPAIPSRRVGLLQRFGLSLRSRVLLLKEPILHILFTSRCGLPILSCYHRISNTPFLLGFGQILLPVVALLLLSFRVTRL